MWWIECAWPVGRSRFRHFRCCTKGTGEKKVYKTVLIIILWMCTLHAPCINAHKRSEWFCCCEQLQLLLLCMCVQVFLPCLFHCHQIWSAETTEKAKRSPARSSSFREIVASIFCCCCCSLYVYYMYSRYIYVRMQPFLSLSLRLASIIRACTAAHRAAFAVLAWLGKRWICQKRKRNRPFFNWADVTWESRLYLRSTTKCMEK